MKQPPTINDRSPRAVNTVDTNGTRLVIQSRQYRTWRKNVAIERLNRCDLCWEDGVITSFHHLHHIKPRETHPHLVMVPTNVQLLCKFHHDEIHGRGEIDLAKLNCTAIVGAPCSGKSSFVSDNAGPTDLVWDWDEQAAAIGISRDDEPTQEQAYHLCGQRMAMISCASNTGQQLWLIVCDAKSHIVKTYADKTVVMRANRDTCLRRLNKRVIVDGLSSHYATTAAIAIRRWFANGAAPSTWMVRPGRRH